MIEERENTIQIIGRWGEGLLSLVGDAVDKLRDRFNYISGKFKITIEFYPDGEEDA